MNIKRLLSLFLVCVMLLSVLASCKKEAKGGADSALEDASSELIREESAVPQEESGEESLEESKGTEESNEEKTMPTGHTPLNYEYMKGIWLYQYSAECLFRSGGKQRDEADYTRLVEQICSNLERDGYNTLFLQVRGHGDSFYPSELYPPSRYAVSDYDSVFEYDPLEIFCDIAHKHNISLQAWLNPYRLLLAGQIVSVPDNYAIKEWFNNKEGDYIIAIDGRYYANPAYEEVQQLVIDGAVEICNNYDIDGIHIDDYFYPSGVTEEFDTKAFNELANGRTLKQFRYDSVNSLVKGMYDAIHAVHPDLLFGISPAGNIENNRGYLSADIDTWCSQPGYIDYIAPQVYWSFDYYRDFAKFDICSINWANLIRCDSVKLVLGIGLYRTVSPTLTESDPGWYLYKDNIKRILEFTYDFDVAEGFIMFDYCSMYDIYSGEYNGKITEELENFLPLLKNEQ
ncbi:MAG: family 10 glycosylhydrolase [Clostridia bacterium]|nr:family 10 glycosylhydrolase [Clostridia bacterium]